MKWWHKSWNPVVGCSETSPGCTNCYAARLASTRLAHTPRYQGLTYNGRWNGSLRTTGAKCPTVRNGEILFVCDMGDLFHDGVGEAEAGAIIRQALDATTTFGSFALLTKRAPTMRRVALATFDADHPPRQAWLGVTAEDQLRHDARVPVARRYGGGYTPRGEVWIAIPIGQGPKRKAK
jgi:protein gp37